MLLVEIAPVRRTRCCLSTSSLEMVWPSCSITIALCSSVFNLLVSSTYSFLARKLVNCSEIS